MNKKTVWTIISIVELIAAIVVIMLDLFIPAVVIVALMVVSLIIRREHIRTMGFKRPKSWAKLVGFVLAGVVILQLFDIGVAIPVLNRLTGTTIDYSGFRNLKGNVGLLVTFLLFTWTLAAFIEEIAFRGYLQKLLFGLFGSSLTGIILTIGISSLLFGLIHTEQGIIGVVVSAIDGIFFGWLKWKHDNNLWASILAHGLYNSLGLIIFFFTGPIYGLW
ncbi:hypothetical protein hrd7_05160 [Leptolinea sp. HRD-7]|nr:hypothetical protein hrd7_05160 [Leptolinea sp. HRD-7]